MSDVTCDLKRDAPDQITLFVEDVAVIAFTEEEFRNFSTVIARCARHEYEGIRFLLKDVVPWPSLSESSYTRDSASNDFYLPTGTPQTF